MPLLQYIEYKFSFTFFKIHENHVKIYVKRLLKTEKYSFDKKFILITPNI